MVTNPRRCNLDRVKYLGASRLQTYRRHQTIRPSRRRVTPHAFDLTAVIYSFQAFAWAHPRIDVHAQMADELTRFLKDEVLK